MNRRTKPQGLSAQSRLLTFASCNASKQLFRLPWSRFRESYDRYPRWQALGLWAEATVRIAGYAPRPMLTTLTQHCPGFAEANAKWEESPAFHLLEWVHANRFGDAKKEGWLDALTFYGVRHPVSRAVWTYFEECEEQWSKRRPASLATFERWWRFGQCTPLHNGPRSGVISEAAERFIEWKAFAFWLEPLLFGSIRLPPHAVSELESRCPELAELSKNMNVVRRSTTRVALWQRLTGICEDRALSRAKRQGWAGILLEQVGSHPLYIRIRAYATRWKQQWRSHPGQSYPTLAAWKGAAAEYINLDHAPRSAD